MQCLRGSCCRDQRSLFARLGPIIYPQDLIGFGGIGFAPGIGGGGGIGIPSGFGEFCFDTALNCVSFVAYCVVPIYRVIKLNLEELDILVIKRLLFCLILLLDL